MKHHPEIIQNEPEWYQMRSGLITMSELGKVMANYPKAFGEPAKKYALNIAIEQITGKPILSAYSNDAMNQGHVLEPIAREMYESRTFAKVENGGFFCDDKFGFSPDGIVGKGLIEIKSSITPFAHFERIRKKSVDSAYKWQTIGALWLTKYEWLDFVSYSQDFPSDKQLFIIRLKPENFQDEFKMIDKRVAEFLELIETVKETIEKSEYFL